MKIKHSMIITFIGGFYVFGGIIILLSLFFNGSAINIIFGLPDVPDHIVKLCVSVIYIPAGYFYIKRSKIAYWIILVCAVITFLISADLTTITGMQPYIGNLIYSLLSKKNFYGRGKEMNKDIKNDLCELISEIRGVKQNINESDSLKNDLGLDSLMQVFLIVAIEDRFHIEIKDSDLSAEDLETVGSLCAMLEKYK